MSLPNPRLLLAVAVLTSIATGIVAGGTASQSPGTPPTPTAENHPPSPGANFTVIPADHSPDTATAYTMLSKGADPWNGSAGLRKIDHYKITTQATQFRDCSPNDAQAFGIDRQNDAPGTRTDEPLLRHMESYSVAGRVIAVDIYESSDLGGSPTYLNDTDETVAKLANCVVTPAEPGWYQFTGYVNGTNYEGQFQEVRLYSNYFYICDCGSRQAARERLGPPPYSEASQDDAGTTTATATAARTAIPTTSTPTATPTVAVTTTAPTAAPSHPESSTTPTANPTASVTRPVGTDPRTGQGPTATANGGGGASSATATPTPTVVPATDGAPDRPRTPTVGSGPGFGMGVALSGLGLVALGTRHRRVT